MKPSRRDLRATSPGTRRGARRRAAATRRAGPGSACRRGRGCSADRTRTSSARVWLTAGDTVVAGPIVAAGTLRDWRLGRRAGGRRRQRREPQHDATPAAAVREAASPGRPAERPAAHQVDVEVVDALAAPAPDVRDEPVAGVGDALRCARARPPPRTAARAAARPPRPGRRRTRCAVAGPAGCASAPAARCRGSRSPGRRRGGASTGSRRRRSGRTGSRARGPSPEHRLRAHQEADRADQPGHQVRDVPLPPGAFLPASGRRPPPRIPTRRRRLGRWMKNAIAEVARSRSPAPRAATAAEDLGPSASDQPDAGQRQARARARACRSTAPRATPARGRCPTRRSRAASAARTAAGSTAGTG